MIELELNLVSIYNWSVIYNYYLYSHSRPFMEDISLWSNCYTLQVL